MKKRKLKCPGLYCFERTCDCHGGRINTKVVKKMNEAAGRIVDKISEDQVTLVDTLIHIAGKML